MSSYVIGVDIGTGSTKAVAVTRSGTSWASAQKQYPTHAPQPGYSEQDPEVICEAFITAIKEVVAQMGQPPEAVSLSSCMHSLILVDANGKPLTPNLTWADRRSAAIAEYLRKQPEGERFYKATGTPLHAMSPLCKIRWLQEHGNLKKFAKAISIKEYVWHRLFQVYEIDYSLASATGLFDIDKKVWFEPALQFCGITTSQLSQPVSSLFIRSGLTPEAASVLHLPAETLFCIGSSDGCLANVGSNALEPGVAAITIGTSGAVRIALSKPVALFPEMLFNYLLDAETFICGGAVNNGGNIVQWLVTQLLGKTTSATAFENLFEKAAQASAGAEGLLCLPYLYGERTPLWDERTSGVFFGVRPQHGTAQFVRAALEGVCLALYGVLKKLEVAAGPIHTVHVSGGLVHAPFWMQLLADVTGKKLCLLSTEDSSAVGAALLYFKAADGAANYTALPNADQKIIMPDKANAALYAESFNRFERLYQTLKPLMHEG